MTLTVVIDALAIFALSMFALAIEALLIVASPMLAFGMVAVPVNTGLSIGALSEFNKSSPAIRALISSLMVAVKLARWATMSEFVELPITMSVINVL